MTQATMKDIEEFYILGLPIETEIGKAEFIRLKDYPNYFADLQIIGMSKLEILHRYSELNKNGELNELLEELNKLDLFTISFSLEEIRQAYIDIFSKVFGNEKVLEKIDGKNFNSYRQTIMKMNCVQEEEINPNPEIQRAIDRSKRVKAQGQGKLTFADMCSSIVAHSGVTYEDMQNWTIYQFHMTFQRIGQMKNYDTTTLFATVPTEKPVNIESWSKHIDLFEKEEHFVTDSQFKKSTGSVFTE